MPVPAASPALAGVRIPLLSEEDYEALVLRADHDEPGARRRLAEEDKKRRKALDLVRSMRAKQGEVPQREATTPQVAQPSPLERFRSAFARVPKPALSTGLRELDALLDDGGLPRGEVTVYTADVGHGKTAFGARLVAGTTDERVWYLAAEPCEDELYARIGAPLVGVPYAEMRRWPGDRAEAELLPAIRAIVDRLEIARGLEAFAQLEERVAAGFNFTGWLIVGDYVQKFARQLRGDRRAAVGRVMDALHGAARLGATVVALSQINRDAARRGQDVHSAAESADIERDAALLIGASRAGRWGGDQHVTLRLTVLKQRFAPGDVFVEVTFDRALGTFGAGVAQQGARSPRTDLKKPSEELATKIRDAWALGITAKYKVAQRVGGRKQTVIDAIDYLQALGEGPGLWSGTNAVPGPTLDPRD